MGAFGDMDLNQSSADVGKYNPIPKTSKILPKQTLGLDGNMDLSRPDSINHQIPNTPSKSKTAKRQDTLKLSGEFDSDRPKSHFSEDPSLLSRSTKIIPKQTLGLDGPMDLTRPDSINQQVPNLNYKMGNLKRGDSLGEQS